MRNHLTVSPVAQTIVAPASDAARQQRTLAGVMAQYIQDLARAA